MSEDIPDMTKPLSRFNAPHWAMERGVAAAAGAPAWAVLCALYSHLPNVHPGITRIGMLSGVSVSTVKRARKELKRVGAIDFAEHDGGNNDEGTPYQVADIRNANTAAAIVAKLNHPVQPDTGVTVNRVQNDTGTGFSVTQNRVQSEPQSTQEKVHKVSTQDGDASASSSAGKSLPRESDHENSQTARDSKPVIQTAGKKPKGKRETLTDAEKLRICETSEAMFTYLAEGNQWYAEGASSKEVAPAATVPQLAAFWWWCVSYARNAARVPLSIPDFPRILGAVKQLRQTMTQDELVELMRAIGKHWETIRESLAWMSSPPALDEATLNNRHIREAAARLMRGETLKTSAVNTGRAVGVGQHIEGIEEFYALTAMPK